MPKAVILFALSLPALCLILRLSFIHFARRCPSLSGLVQTHTTTPLSNIRPWFMLLSTEGMKQCTGLQAAH